MTLRTVGRAVGVTLASAAILAAALVFTLKWHFGREQAEHAAPVQALVSRRASKAEVREQLREPPFIGSAAQRELLGRDLLSFWAMPKETRDRIEHQLREHPETWVYWGTYVDFLFFDSSGRLAASETISN